MNAHDQNPVARLVRDVRSTAMSWLGTAATTAVDRPTMNQEGAGMPDHANTTDLRCSAVLFRQHSVLLVHRTYDSTDDWVLPGGTPRPGESTIACTRREVREETGLAVDPAGVIYVLEAAEPGGDMRTVDLVFLVTEAAATAPPQQLEPGMDPQFVPLDQLHELDLRPPLAGHLRGLHLRGATPSAAYLGNLWRPTTASPDQSPASEE